MNYILKKIFKIYFLLSLCFIFFLIGAISAYKNNLIYSWLYGSVIKVENLIKNNQFVYSDNYKILNDFNDYIIFIQELGNKIILTSKTR